MLNPNTQKGVHIAVYFNESIAKFSSLILNPACHSIMLNLKKKFPNEHKGSDQTVHLHSLIRAVAVHQGMNLNWPLFHEGAQLISPAGISKITRYEVAKPK